MNTKPEHSDPDSSLAFTSLLLLLSKALKKAKVPYVEVTTDECMSAVKDTCPIRIVRGVDPKNPTKEMVRAYLNGPMPEEERSRIIRLS